MSDSIQETDDELSLDYLMSMNSYDDVADDDS